MYLGLEKLFQTSKLIGHAIITDCYEYHDQILIYYYYYYYIDDDINEYHYHLLKRFVEVFMLFLQCTACIKFSHISSEKVSILDCLDMRLRKLFAAD